MHSLIYRLIIGLIGVSTRSLEKLRDRRENQIQNNHARIVRLQIASIDLERESHSAERLASKLRTVLG